MSGTTRDAVDTPLTLDSGEKLVLVDTAGVRKRTKVADSKDGAEQLSVDRALRAASRAEVAVLVVDASEGVTQQDYRLAELLANSGRAVVVVANKWDKAAASGSNLTPDTFVEDLRSQLRQVSWASVVVTTATRGRRVPDVLAAVLEAGRQHRRRVSTATLNLVVREALQWKMPPSVRGSRRQGRVYYATQASTAPPTFIMFVNDPRLFPEDYRRYMESQLRENVGFKGTPLRLWWRGKGDAQGGRRAVEPKPGAQPRSGGRAPATAGRGRRGSSKPGRGGGRGSGTRGGGRGSGTSR